MVSPRPAAETVEALAAGPDSFLLTGQGGLIMSSPDGLVWTRRQAGTREQFPVAAHHHGLWLAYGYSGALFTSTDTMSWSQRTNRHGTGRIAYGNGRWVATTSGSAMIVRSSPDGQTWTETTLPADPPFPWIYGLSFATGRFWLAAGRGPAAEQLWSSPDGITWTHESTAPDSSAPLTSVRSLFGSGERLIAVYNTTGSGVAFTRDVTGTWTQLDLPGPINDFAFVAGRYLLRSDLTTYSSTDGRTWTELADFPPNLQLQSIVIRDEVWLGLDRNKLLLRALNGTGWGSVSHRFRREGEGLAFVNGHFLTANGIVSADGRNWSETGFNVDDVKSGGFRRFLQISPVNGRAIITVSRDSAYEFWLTEDGFTGQQVAQFGISNGWPQVHYASGVYAALNSNDGELQLHTSTNAMDWTSRPITELDPQITRIIRADGTTFYGETRDFARYRSTDAVNWSPLPEDVAPPGPTGAIDVGWAYPSGGIESAVDGDLVSVFRLPALANSLAGLAIASGNGVTVAMAGDIFAVATNDEDLTLTAALPDQLDAVAGESVTLAVAASSASGAPVTYQWNTDGVDIAGETGPTLVRTYNLDGPRPSSIGVRVTSGGETFFCETTLRLFAEPGPVFSLADAPHLRASYRYRANDRYDVSLWAPVSSPGTTTFTWRRDGEVIPGATGDTLTYEITPATVGTVYTVTVANERGSITSGDYTETGPQPEVRNLYFTTSFDESRAEGYLQLRLDAPFSQAVQWRRNGVPIPGATGFNYTDHDLTRDESGFYDAVLSSPFGALSTDSLFVAATSGRLANLSVRAWSGSGDETLVPGVVLARNTSYLQTLVRAVGPGLAAYGVEHPLTAPTLNVIDQEGALRATNADWSQYDFDLTPFFQLLGAFPLELDSRDAAVFVDANLPVANRTSRFTVPVSAPAGDEGELLVEVYRSGGSPTDRLINLSTRALAGPGKPFVAGFVIDGDGPVKLLIRGIGPTLADYGVSGAMPNPRLVLRDAQGDEIGNNDTWSAAANAADIEAARARVGGFSLPTASNDAALFVTLDPGRYTVQLQGVLGSTGVAMIELYEVP